MFKDINRDIKVSWIFTILSYLVLIGIILRDVIIAHGGMSAYMLFYGLPFCLLSVFFSRTAVRIQIDEKNTRAIQASFYLALTATGLSFLWLLITGLFF